MRVPDIVFRLPTFGLVLYGTPEKNSIDEPQSQQGNRRALLRSMVGAFGSLAVSTAIFVPPAISAETVGKDPDCNDRSCLGVWDGLLADCPHGLNGGAGCTSSQDDTPGIFSEP